MEKTINLNVREKQEQNEQNRLSEFASKSAGSKGRKTLEDKCFIRTDFQKDRDRIVHSKAFRRLKHKTQVFFAPYDDHFRTRLTHTLEVSQVARTIARALDLNEDLTEAIALGHDLGHTPFGHCGEDALNEVLDGGFKHNVQSYRTVSVIEDLNLTAETLDGILCHSGNLFDPKLKSADTLEGQIVKLSDKIAYINHDIEDAIRANIITESDLPKECNDFFTSIKSERMQKMIVDIVENSLNRPEIRMSEQCLFYMNCLKNWMFENVYFNPVAKAQEYKSRRIVLELFDFYLNTLSVQFKSADENILKTTVADYIAGMTDRYAVQKYEQFFVPTSLKHTTQDDFLFKLAGINGL